MTRALAETYDCESCGACCFGRRDYVQVFPHDAKRLGRARVSKLVAAAVGEHPASEGRPAEPERYMKMIGGHCAALHSPAPDRFHCAVYEDRPTLCRALEPGSQSCLDARARQAVFAQTR